jgi:hypothetical protein
MGKSAEVGIRNGWMPVDGNRQDVASFGKDELLAVSVVVIDIQHRHVSIRTQVMGGDSGVVEITEPPENVPLGMVSRRPDQGVSDPESPDDFFRGRQGAIHRPFRGNEGIAAQRREGVDTVVSGPDGQLHRGVRPVPDGEHVRIHGRIRWNFLADMLEIADIFRVVNGQEGFLGKFFRGESREEIGLLQGVQDRLYPNRRFHISPFVDMVDGMPVINNEGDLTEKAGHRVDGSWLFPEIARFADPDGIILDGREDHPDIRLAAHLPVLFLENGLHHPAQILPPGCNRLSEAVEDQVRRVVAPGFQGRFIGRVRDGPSAEGLVKSETRPVLFEDFRIPAQGGIVGKALEKQAFGLQQDRFFPDPFVEGAADTPADGFLVRHQVVEITEANHRFVGQKGEPSDLSGGLDLGDVENGAKVVLERIAEQVRNLGDVCLAESPEPGSQDLLDLLQRLAVSRQDVVEDPSDVKHG